MEPEDDGLDLPPFDWEKLFRWLFLIGLALWVLGGTISTIVISYFSDFPDGGVPSSSGTLRSLRFATDSETVSSAAAVIATLTLTLQAIAFQVWIASGLLLVFLWFRAITSHVEPPTPN